MKEADGVAVGLRVVVEAFQAAARALRYLASGTQVPWTRSKGIDGARLAVKRFPSIAG